MKAVKIIVTLIIIITFSGAGCNENMTIMESQTGAFNSINNENAAEEGGLPLTKEIEELRISTFDNWYAPKSFALNLPVFQKIEKKTNVKVVWEVYPFNQADDIQKTLFASGQDLPDIVFGWMDYKKYYESGLICDLSLLIDQYAPNIKTLLTERPDVSFLLTEPDGIILRLSVIAPTRDFLPAYIIREDWLEKVDKKVPATIDELIDVLRAFRDMDPNNNGEKDEIPFAYEAPYWIDVDTGDSFGVHPSHDFYPDKSSRIEYVPMTEEYKVMLKYLNNLYEEKLLDRDFTTCTYEKYNSMIENNLVGCVIHWMKNAENYNSITPNARWIAFAPPKGSNSDVFVETRDPISGNCVITRDCKNPVLAIKWLDYIMASEDGKRYANWGIEGLTYNTVDGGLKYTDFVLNNQDNIEDPLRSIGCQWNLPRIMTEDIENVRQPEEILKLNTEYQKIITESYPSSLIPMTNEEEKEFSKGWSELDAYETEMQYKFIMGIEPFEKWDKYVDKLIECGINQKIEIEQRKYERYINYLQSQ